MPRLYALILSGGAGTRLWPLSRRGKPKQFLQLTGERTLVQDTVERVAEIIPVERIFAVPDTRPLSASDLSAVNRRHDDMLAHSPWFRLWQRYGVCCRS